MKRSEKHEIRYNHKNKMQNEEQIFVGFTAASRAVSILADYTRAAKHGLVSVCPLSALSQEMLGVQQLPCLLLQQEKPLGSLRVTSPYLIMRNITQHSKHE